MSLKCLYFHINPIKQEVFYVGIGNIKRPYSKSDRNKAWHNIVNKYNYEVIIIHENLDWEEVCKLEKQYIAQLGRRDQKLGSLVNFTNGGEGNEGLKLSKKTKLRMSKSKLGNSNRKGTKTSLEARLNMSKGRLGKIPWNKGLKTGPLSEQDKINKSIAAIKRYTNYKLKKENNGI